MAKEVKIALTIRNSRLASFANYIGQHEFAILTLVLSLISIIFYYFYFHNNLALAYNDARSHLDIGRRVVEGLKPGLAQLGSVWLPLPHLLMVPTIWNDFMWHSGLAGAIQSMIAFVATGVLIAKFLEKIGVGIFPRIFAVIMFVANINILYLQSTAMTELLLMATMTAGAYYFTLWFRDGRVIDIIKASFWIMLATLNRYDGWFLIFYTTVILGIWSLKNKGYKNTEGLIILFCTLGGLGIAGWFLWNLLIFNDPLYFAFGPFSARAQQEQLEEAGQLFTKGNLWVSTKVYMYALLYSTYTLPTILGIFGALAFWFDRKIKPGVRIASTALFVPLMFNILALFLGHSVLFIQGISGNTWFNVRYGTVLAPAIAIFTGYLIHRFRDLKWLIVGIFSFVIFFAFASGDAVTIDDARVGSSQKNVTEVSGWLNENAKDREGFVLISAASHDAIIFSSGLPMKRFIHEGTGAYWESAVISPDLWARWIVMRTHDVNDLVFKEIKDTEGYTNYNLVESFPFADIYELKPEYVDNLNTKPVFGKQK